MSDDEVKEWVERQDALKPFRIGATLSDLIVAEVESLGFERIRVSQVGPHPVWSIRGRLGQSLFDCDQKLSMAFKRVARNLGFDVKVRDIIATLRGGRLQVVICLDKPLESLDGDSLLLRTLTIN